MEEDETYHKPKVFEEHPKKRFSIDTTASSSSAITSPVKINSINNISSNYSSESLHSRGFSPPIIQNNTKNLSLSSEITHKPNAIRQKFTRRNSLIGLFSRNSFSTMVGRSAQLMNEKIELERRFVY